MWKQIFLKITEMSRGLRRVSFSFRFYELQTVSQCECLSMVLREKGKRGTLRIAWGQFNFRRGWVGALGLKTIQKELPSVSVHTFNTLFSQRALKNMGEGLLGFSVLKYGTQRCWGG